MHTHCIFAIVELNYKVLQLSPIHNIMSGVLKKRSIINFQQETNLNEIC